MKSLKFEGGKNHNLIYWECKSESLTTLFCLFSLEQINYLMNFKIQQREPQIKTAVTK